MPPIHPACFFPRPKVAGRAACLSRLAVLSLLALPLLTTASAAHAQVKPGKKATPAPPKTQKPPVTPNKSSDQGGNQKGLNFTAVAAEPDVHGGFYTNSYAIIIGISHYKDASKNLEYAAADADALAKILVEKYDFPAEHVTELTNEKATRENIEKALSEIKNPKKYTDRTRVIVFFSGHGQTVKSKDGTDKGFLIPYDEQVDLQHPENEDSYLKTCLRMDTLWGYLTDCKVNLHALLIADACYGGLLFDKKRGFGGEGDEAERPSAPVIAKNLAQNALEVLTAGGKGEPVIENSEWGHGAFTFKLLEMLRKRAAKPNDVFLASQLGTALAVSVGDLTKGRQSPQFGKRDSEGDVVFYTAGAASPVRVTSATATASHPTGSPSGQSNPFAQGTLDSSSLVGLKLTVKPQEDWDPRYLQEGAEVYALVSDELRDVKGHVIPDAQGNPLIPVGTRVVAHVRSSYHGVLGGNILKGAVNNHVDQISVSCDYVLVANRKIPFQENVKSAGGFKKGLLPGNPRHIIKADNTRIDLKIAGDSTSTDADAPSAKEE